MARERLATLMIREILRRHFGERLPLSKAALACGVAEYGGGVLPAGKSPGAGLAAAGGHGRWGLAPPALDFEAIHREFRRKSVTL